MSRMIIYHGRKLYGEIPGLRTAFCLHKKAGCYSGFLYYPSPTAETVIPYHQYRYQRARSDKNSEFSGRKRNAGIVFGGLSLLYGAAAVVSLENESPSVGFPDVPAIKSETEGDKVKITRKIENPQDTSGLRLRLYQYQSCPFCCKVRAFLNYYGFSYEVVEVNPASRSQIKFAKCKKLPLLVVQGYGDKVLYDSSFIVSLLRTFTLDPKKDFQEVINYYPHHKVIDENGKEGLKCENKYFVMFHEQVKTKEGIAKKREEREWREWVDDCFVHVISPNVYRTLRESVETFQWFSEFGNWNEIFKPWERLAAIFVGSVAMFWIGKKLRKKHNLKDDIRESLYDAAAEWTTGLGYRRFMGGNEPNLADLALYGAMSSFEGCSAFKDLLKNNSEIGPWFYAVQDAVMNSQGASEYVQNLTK